MITFLSLTGSVVIGVITAWLAGRSMSGNGAAIVLFVVHVSTGRRDGHRLWS
jgi:hypothetical protein